MTQDRLTNWLRVARGRKGPMVIAASFFSLSSFIIVFGYVRGYRPTEVYLTLLANFVISLSALGLRWIEKHCPPTPSSDAGNQQHLEDSDHGAEI